MNVLPVIVRELRQQARQRFTFTLRVGGAGLLTAAAVLLSGNPLFGPQLGGRMFALLHFTLLLCIWVLVPLSAADCISRERREGTLGLLLLTPLRAHEIVLAKTVAHGLRAMTLLLAVLPVLTIPVLLGGVTWQQAALSALVNFTAMCWALAAGLVASSGARSGLRASVAAVVFAVVAFLAHAVVLGALVATRALMRGNLTAVLESGLTYRITPLVSFGTGGAFGPLSILPTAGGTVTSHAVLTAGTGVVALSAAVLLAAFWVRRNWREEPLPEWMQEMQKTFCTPVLWKGWLENWMRWKIDRNPVGWLEQRTWTGRLVMWTWLAIIISLCSAMFADRFFFRNYSAMHTALAWLMMGSIAASAAGSFRRERESGVLELLLVTPLSAAQIVGGRLRALWGQFFPAMAALAIIWLYAQSIFHRTGEVGKVTFFAATFVTLPVVGLYFSLRSRGFVTAFVLTMGLGILVPLQLERILMFCLLAFVAPDRQLDGSLGPRPGAVVFQAAIAVWLWLALEKRLRGRQFPLERGGP